MRISNLLKLALVTAILSISQGIRAQAFFEAECGIIGNEWQTNVDTNASESIFVIPTNDRAGDFSGGGQPQPIEDLISYQITVPVIGTYDVYALVSAAAAGESFFLSYDNDVWWAHTLPATGGFGTYDWVDLEDNIQNGTYQQITTTSANEVVTIFMAYRENEVRIDKFALLINDTDPATIVGQGDDVGSCFDFGDAPDTNLNDTGTGDYISLLGNTTPGPIHLVDDAPAVFLGSTAPDTEDDALQNADATGDDANDEGEAQLISTAASDVFPAIATASTSYSLEIDVTNNKAVDATVVAWIDFDGDGVFEAGEQADTNPVVAASAGSTQATLNWTGLTGLVSGDTFARFRISTDTELTTKESTDVVIDGEVEDHLLAIEEPPELSEVFFEAECGIIGNEWQTNVDTNASESIFVIPTNDRAGDFSGGGQPQPIEDLISYQITVPVIGTYDVYALVSAAAAGESFFLSYDNDVWWAHTLPATGGFGTYDWVDLEDNIQNGTYQQITTTSANEVVTIFMAYRENEVRIDKFALLANDTDPATIVGQGADVGSCFDFGDAPDTALDTTGTGDYVTLLSNTLPGPIHLVDESPAVFLGNVAPDTEDDALQNATATGDDALDEGEAQLVSTADGDVFPAITVSSTSFSVEVDVTNSKAVDATVVAWIDFDRDGVFEAGELADASPTIAASAGSTTETLTWTGLSGLTDGDTFARFRISTDTELTTKESTDVVIDGEVEDHLITINLDIVDDYGDAPSIYGDAIHTVELGATLYLGPAFPDGETESQQGGDGGLGADGDDGDGNDDESSVTSIPILTTDLIGQTYSLNVNVVNTADDASADLFGWIDFDGSDTFDTDEAVTINTPATGIYQLQWTVPGDVVIGDTFIRLRLTSDATVLVSTPFGTASDGEVEDYAVSVTVPLDFGDAIDSAIGTGTLNYRTELADDGARHQLDAGLFLGDTAPDADGDATDNGTASGDDSNGTADEGIEQLLITAQGSEFPDLTVADSSFDFDIDLTNTTSAAELFVWVDYDQNGAFDEDELAGGAAIPIAPGASSASISSVPTNDALVGNTFMRLRLATAADLVSGISDGVDEGVEDVASFGEATAGEVEDYRITIMGLDFGDAPDSYATDRADGGEGVGPSHIQTGTLFIGDVLPDLDLDGIPTSTASGDDADGDDEGGYFIPVIGSSDTSYSITVPLVNNTGSDATLFGWLDLNEDGDFDAAESVSVTVPSGSLSATLSGGPWASFTALGGTQTYLRLRLTSDVSINSSTPGGLASNGEVEDHLVIVGLVDFGDAPDTYSTNLTAGDTAGGFDQVGPSHGITSTLFIGTTQPDGEIDGQPSVNATDDDTTGTADELPFTFPLLTPATEIYTLTTVVTNTTGLDAELVGWIDFDNNGFFDNDEAATVTVADSDISADLVWNNIPGDIVVADTFMRLRLTSDTSIATGDPLTSVAINAAFNGEIEDHAISIETAFDYGDAPDSYGTDGTNSSAEGFGPRHIISPLLFLGALAPDAESDGQPSADGLLDDNTGTGAATVGDSTDGDEGDLFVTTIQPDQTSYTISVPLVNATGSDATLYGWIDINQDGDFLDPAEQQTTTILAGASFGTLTWTWTAGNTSGGNGLDNGNTFMRLRLSSDSGLEPNAASSGDFASDGEVEDYRILVSLLTCDLIYGIYNVGGFTRLREFDNDTIDLPGNPTTVETAGIGIDRIFRRLYYAQRNNGTENSLFYYDATLSTPNVDSGGNFPAGGADNYNRMAFSFDGRGVVVESTDFDIHLFDPTLSGTGQTITNAITMANEASILGVGGDVSFDRDDNLYMLTYTTALPGAEFFLYEIEFFNTGDDPLVDTPIEIPDLVLTGSPETAFFANASLLLTEDNTTGEDIAGMAFNFDNLIYLQGDGGATFTWDVGITASGGAGAIQPVAGGGNSADLASCIYPFIRAIIEPVKTVVNQTSGGSGYIPGDVLEYTIVVRNSGGFPSFDTIFQDDIQPGTTYVPNSTTMNGEPLVDTGGLMPFVVGREIHTDGEPDGTVLADITPGIIGDNEVVITYQVAVDSDGANTTICNQGFVDFDANLSPSPIPTNDPSTGTADDPTCLTQTSGFRVSGTLYEDLNVDAIQSAAEPGIEGVAMVLYDSVAGTCESTLTDANGFYEFESVSGGPKTIFEVNGASVPVPAACPPNALGVDPSGFLSSTLNSTNIFVINSNITDLDFGDVRLPSLNPNLEGVVEPGGIQTYSHLFRAPTNGLVSFATVSTDSPLLAGWNSLIYEDLDCSGDLTSGDTPINSSISLVAGESICLINRVFAPTAATVGNTLLTDITATFNYDGALVSDQDVDAQDLTTVLDEAESALQLTKRVRNITDTSDVFDVVAGISNQANPGDRLRYEISFTNNGVGNISDIDIYDVTPAFTELAEVLDLSCNYTGPVSSPLTAIVPPTIMTSCTVITPAGGANAPGYTGSIHWQLTGVLQPGESGLIVFTVDVD